MKRTGLGLGMLVLATAVQAGLLGWFTAEKVDWETAKRNKVGIAPVVRQDGRPFLPVRFDPWLLGSGKVVRKITVQRHAARLVVQIVTQVVEDGAGLRPPYGVGLTGFPPGKYEVFYETAGDPAKSLGWIELRSPGPENKKAGPG